jgi:hypothetical protein
LLRQQAQIDALSTPDDSPAARQTSMQQARSSNVVAGMAGQVGASGGAGMLTRMKGAGAAGAASIDDAAERQFAEQQTRHASLVQALLTQRANSISENVARKEHELQQYLEHQMDQRAMIKELDTYVMAIQRMGSAIMGGGDTQSGLDGYQHTSSGMGLNEGHSQMGGDGNIYSGEGMSTAGAEGAFAGQYSDEAVKTAIGGAGDEETTCFAYFIIQSGDHPADDRGRQRRVDHHRQLRGRDQGHPG